VDELAWTPTLVAERPFEADPAESTHSLSAFKTAETVEVAIASVSAISAAVNRNRRSCKIHFDALGRRAVRNAGGVVTSGREGRGSPSRR
jgi:hypothetical protein